MAEQRPFSYDLAFDRNIGWLTEWEQQALRGKRVAIAGMGGVGGVHLLTLARLGIGAFHIADFDSFDLVNFNRQIGATVETIGRPKAEVLEEMARGINPELRIKRFDQGIAPENVDAFLKDVDLFVDGFDFFALQIRRQVFARCRELGIPAVTAAPIGMGAGFLAFTPDGMSFEEYFRLEGQSEKRQYLRFLMGVAPRGLHRPYLVDPSRVDLEGHRGPSTVAACQLCAGVTAVAALKLLLRRGDVKPAPYHHHFDPYRGRLAVTRLRFGNAGPLQSLKLAIAERIYGAMSKRASANAATPPASPIEEILNAARWAPSGDNAQPWRFQIIDNDTVVVHLRDHSAQDVYEYRGGEPTLLSGGMLLESMRIAASAWRRGIEWRHDGRSGDRHCLTIRFPSRPAVELHPLYSCLPLRSVDRRPYRLRALTSDEKRTLEEALGGDLVLDWHEDTARRWRLARLSARATDIRLRIPETFAIHQRVVDWANVRSPEGIPAAAVGLDPASRMLMRWAMRDWRRMRALNRISGTLLAALEMDYWPGLASAAWFTVRLRRTSVSGDRTAALLGAGESIQRFWLTATRLGLAVHPGLATLAFAHYGEMGTPFTTDAAMRDRAKRLAGAFRAALGAGTEEFVFIGRIGEPRSTGQTTRSTRRPLSELIEARAAAAA